VGAVPIGSAPRAALAEALKKKNLTHDIDKGGGAFYGPKVDIKIRDCLGRYWQCSTVQVDFTSPSAFDVTYRDETRQRSSRPSWFTRLAGIDRTLYRHPDRASCGGLPAVAGRPYRPRSSRSPTARMKIWQKVARSWRERFSFEADLRMRRSAPKKRDALLEKVPLLLTVGDREMQAQQWASQAHR